MVRRDIRESQWKRKQYGPNVAALDITLQDRRITIINVYNPKGNGPRIREWEKIAQALQDTREETILLGDFNTHHQAWGGGGVACEKQAEHLLVETRRAGLWLMTPQGDPTWTRGEQATTIDLSFASYELSTRVVYCGTEPSWRLTPDHIPIRITLDIGASRTQAQSRRYAL
jgi:endonuclease/exonuclease/phosphatase family metal-dependent hydrolase